MAKVISLHPLDLRPEANAEELERFFQTAMAAYTRELQGWTQHLLKSLDDARDGHNVVLLEVESQAALERYFPRSGSPSAEDAQVFEKYAATFDKLRTFVVSFPDPRAHN